jgi:dTDP-4-dehydrorhamnose 3,5-epimerase
MNIEGVEVFVHDGSADARGSFTKVFRRDRPPFEALEPFVECYYSTSRRGVIRGLHFQTPPHEHVKLVTCISGSAFDCIVDLRKASRTYGEAFYATLGPGEAILIPKGCAHGFCAVSEEATLLYHVTSVHAPAHDAGIHWTSADVPWPVSEPVISERDRALPHLHDYASPF